MNINSTIQEKIKYAEYGTPQFIRTQMLKTIPPLFWKNKSNKIFEPAVGKGGFIVDIIKILMKSLTVHFPQSKLRYKHIVENILYFADINAANIRKLKKLLDPIGIYKLNAYIGDSLTLPIGIQFNLVVGNPPYNISGKKGVGSTLYQHFIRIALTKWLLPKGYLLYVTPPSWRKPNPPNSINSGLWELMTRDNQMVFLEIHDMKDGIKVFNAHTRYDFYLIKRTPTIRTTSPTKIIDQLGKKSTIDLTAFPWLPNFDFKFVKSLLVKNLTSPRTPKLDILFDLRYLSKRANMSPKKSAKFQYLCVHTTPQKGTRYFYSAKRNRGHFDIPKVIFGNSGPHSAVLNKKGEYCMTEHAMAIADKKKNLAKILRALQSERMKRLFAATLWSSFQIEWRMFSYFRKDFYKFFTKTE
jgi:hypothetical protein